MEKYHLSPQEIEELEKKGYAYEEIVNADQVVSTYENWLDPDYKIENFSRGISSLYKLENGDSTSVQGEGKLTLFILPEIEWQKIEDRKAEVLEAFVKAYTNALFDFFNEKYRDNKEKKRLVEQEIQRLETLLFQDKVRVDYGVFTETLVLYLYTFPNTQRGSMYYHYDQVIVKGLYGYTPTEYIRPSYVNLNASDLQGLNSDLHFVVAAFACERFKAYLKFLLESGSQVIIQKPQIKPKYCCNNTLKIMEGLVTRFDVTQIEVRHFEDFFEDHPYTNLDYGNKYRHETTKDLDFERLLTKIFDFSNLFNDEVKNYFFTCCFEDGERKNSGRIGETDYHILKKKIQERRSTSEIKIPQTKAGRKPNPPRTFQSLFKGEPEMNQLLDAAVFIGLIVKEGDRYTWPDERNKSHLIRAFWYTAIDAGLAGKNFKNKETIAKAIKEFFRMESLSKDTIENENPHHEVYQRTKAALEKRMKVQ